MRQKSVGMIVVILLVLLVIWLATGGSISCHDSFWNKDNKVIEIKHD